MLRSVSLALLLAASAQAADVTIATPLVCTNTRVCFSPPNDAGLAIDYLGMSSTYGRVTVSIAGDLYDSGLYAVPRGTQSVSALPLYDGAGHVIYATATMITVQTGPCVREGRVTECPFKTTLTYGLLGMP